MLQYWLTFLGTHSGILGRCSTDKPHPRPQIFLAISFLPTISLDPGLSESLASAPDPIPFPHSGQKDLWTPQPVGTLLFLPQQLPIVVGAQPTKPAQFTLPLPWSFPPPFHLRGFHCSAQSLCLRFLGKRLFTLPGGIFLIFPLQLCGSSLFSNLCSNSIFSERPSGTSPN